MVNDIMNDNDYIVVFGGCSLDVTFKELETGGYDTTPTIVSPGGKGANQAVAASRAGARVKMISLVGAGEEAENGIMSETQIGKLIVSNLEQNGVDTSCVEFKEGIKNDVSAVYVSKEGDNDIHRQNGAIDSFYCEMIDKNAEIIKNARYVIAQMKAPIEVTRYLFDFCKKNNVPVVVTPCRPQRLADNLDLIDKVAYITANEKECKTIFGSDDVEECVRRCNGKLIVTLGADGLMFLDNGKIQKYPSFYVQNVVDTTGAGDTLNGNLVACLMEGKPLNEALLYGMAASTIKIQSKTAQQGMPYKKERDEFLAKKKQR